MFIHNAVYRYFGRTPGGSIEPIEPLSHGYAVTGTHWELFGKYQTRFLMKGYELEGYE